jgi:hypothetical protein
VKEVSMTALSRKEWVFVWVLGCAYVFFWLICQQDRDLSSQDLLWYLNRGQLFWRGDFTHFFSYNLIYPMLVGAINLIIPSILLSSLLVNGIIGGFFLLGLYWIGVHYFNRTITIMALTLIMSHVHAIGYMRQMQPMFLFCTLLLWYIILTHAFIKYPSYRMALTMGLFNIVLFFTRGEGLFYGIFIVVGCLAFLYKTLNLRTTIGYFFTATIPMGLAFLLYNLLIRAGGFVLTREDLFTQLSIRPTDFAFVSSELLKDSNLLLSFWGGLWLVVAWAWLYYPTYRRSSLLFLGLLVFHASVIFVALRGQQVGAEAYYLFIFVCSSLLLSWALYGATTRLQVQRFLPLLVIVIALVNLQSALNREQLSPPLRFLNDQHAEDARIVDQWLIDNNLMDSKIYTLCHDLVGHSQSKQHFLFRSGYNFTLPNQWDSPENLLPRMASENAIFMSCDLLYSLDWQTFFANDLTIAGYRLERIGQPTSNYVYYRVVLN